MMKILVTEKQLASLLGKIKNWMKNPQWVHHQLLTLLPVRQVVLHQVLMDMEVVHLLRIIHHIRMLVIGKLDWNVARQIKLPQIQNGLMLLEVN